MHSFFYAAILLASTFTFSAAIDFDVSSNTNLASCGVKGFDKSRAYNFLNDTMTANFEKCSARCVADSACVSFAFGSSQCLLYTQTVASNVNENSASPFNFYDRYCESSSAPSSVVSSSQTTSESKKSTSYESPIMTSKTESSSGYHSYVTHSYSSSSSSKVESSSSMSAMHPAETTDMTSWDYAYPTGSDNSSYSEREPYSETSDVTSASSYIVSSTSSFSASPSVTPYPTHPSSEGSIEGPETVVSYIDVTITTCPSDVDACPTGSQEGSPPTSSSTSSSSSGVSPGLVSSSSSLDGSPSHPITSEAPTQSSAGHESYTTVITTHYVGTCPTGYTTIPYTTTYMTAPGASSTPEPPANVPAGFTTTVVVCSACVSESPTVTLTVPIVSVMPVPVTSSSLSADPPSAGSPTAGVPSAGSPPADSASAGPSPAGPSPAGSTRLTQTLVSAGSSSSSSATSSSTALSPKPATSSTRTSGVPTVATPPYNAGNATASFSTSRTSAGASTGLSGAEATRPVTFTGGASESTEGTFAAVLIAAIWAGLMVV